MLSAPRKVAIHCYGCSATVPVDPRWVGEGVRIAGWSTDRGRTYCPTCAAARGLAAPWSAPPAVSTRAVRRRRLRPERSRADADDRGAERLARGYDGDHRCVLLRGGRTRRWRHVAASHASLAARARLGALGAVSGDVSAVTV